MDPVDPDYLLDQLHRRHPVDPVDRRYPLDLVGLEGLYLVILGDRRTLGYPEDLGFRRHLMDPVVRILRRHLELRWNRLGRIHLLVRRDPVDPDLHLNHRYLELRRLLLDLARRWRLVGLVVLVDSHKLDLVLVRAF